MDVSAIAAAGMQADIERLSVVGQNIANVLTPGYKRQVFNGASFSQSFNSASSSAGRVRQVSIDPSAGALRATGNSHDIALDGPGFLTVDKNGETAYTRSGSLHVDKLGQLITGEGFPVLGDGGSLTLEAGEFSIAADGEVRQSDRRIGKLNVVQFENPEALTSVGGVFLQGGARVAPLPANVYVKTGFQEASNVNSPQEMISLTETVRHYESLQRLMQGMDDSLGTTLRKLGDF